MLISEEHISQTTGDDFINLGSFHTLTVPIGSLQ